MLVLGLDNDANRDLKTHAPLLIQVKVNDFLSFVNLVKISSYEVAYIGPETQKISLAGLVSIKNIF